MLVKPIATTERGELRAAGETCKRQVTESTTQVGRLEIRDTEQPLAPLRPSEVEGAGDIAALDPKPLQGRVEGLPSDRRVAHRDGEARARKDLVAHEERGRQFLYRAKVDPQLVQRNLVGDLVERLFDGDPLALVNHLLRAGEIELGELDDLRKQVAEAEKKQKKERS